MDKTRSTLRKAGVGASMIIARAALPVTASAAPRVVDCSTYADYPNVLISSARGMSCIAARNVMKAYEGDYSASFSAPKGFRCRQVSGAPEGGQWRCVRRAQAFRFEFTD